MAPYDWAQEGWRVSVMAFMDLEDLSLCAHVWNAVPSNGQRRAPVSPNVDLPLTAVQGELLSVAAWYDNEMGYSARLAEAASGRSIVRYEAHVT